MQKQQSDQPRGRAVSLLPFAASLLAGAVALGMGGSGCVTKQPPPPLEGQVHLTLLHTSDIHSRLLPYNLQLGQVDAGLGLGQTQSIVNVGGAARISHIIGRERARSSRVLHLDGGDCFQGAPIFNFYSGEAEIRTLAAMGVDAMIVANHEFDRGALNLGIQLQQNSNFPILAANYVLEDPEEPGASPLGAIIQPYTVFNLDGLRVGVIGMGNLSSMTSLFDAPNRLGITPLNTVEVTQFYVDLLRPSVDLVVFVTHLGLEVDERMIQSTTGIDVVLGGHNHIVLQPPKQVQDCSRYYDEEKESYYILLNDERNPEQGEKQRRYCTPRDVVLAHSGAFAKYVGRLDLVVSNKREDLGENYDPNDGFEVLTSVYDLFPVNENVPEDPIVASTLEPYEQGLDALADLDLFVGYARDGSRRFSTSGGDSPLGNMIATAMWLRLGIQTDFSLTNTTGIRADLVPGPVSIEQLYNIFPFDNAITKMQLSGIEVQDLFDFVARRSAGRGCVSQVQIAGARVVVNCTAEATPGASPGVATNIYIGTYDPPVECPGGDADCPDQGFGSCDAEANRCWRPLDRFSTYELATSDYLGAGGSGFRVLQRNTTQFNTGIQQRDALGDYIRAGAPCGAGPDGNPYTCSTDADCVGTAGEDFVCACPDQVEEGPTCETKAGGSCNNAGACVLRQCRIDIADYRRQTCEAAPDDYLRDRCQTALSPCATGGETCKFLACVDRQIGNFSDGRLRMVGQ
ncbi:bifunctional metallophosphatase/5'-nucleotidase [Chondromyces apiculatus]|uniref:5'-nucleotidase n=1 Tax=Chondromyces apiculatus DSM 436 TaxID=1192034 RepID=A0A017TIE4_9BACT|nr:bifunctional UDP-sugar hydrolase/5'-nucleotidase [Chondromyces apiculatus]EYF08605.1 5'-nucleotidase [Chondromyces apiculatus DSM 436]